MRRWVTGLPDRCSVILGAGSPVRNTRSGELWLAAGPVWAERWADLMVPDRASGRLQGKPFRGSSPGGNRWHHKQLVWGPAGACSEPLLRCPGPSWSPPLAVPGEASRGVCPALLLFFAVFISLGSLHEDKFSLGCLILAFSHGNTQGHNPTRGKTAQKLRQQLASHE